MPSIRSSSLFTLIRVWLATALSYFLPIRFSSFHDKVNFSVFLTVWTIPSIMHATKSLPSFSSFVEFTLRFPVSRSSCYGTYKCSCGCFPDQNSPFSSDNQSHIFCFKPLRSDPNKNCGFPFAVVLTWYSFRRFFRTILRSSNLSRMQPCNYSQLSCLTRVDSGQ